MQNVELHEVQIDPRLEWIRPFLRKAVSRLPGLALPHRIVLARASKPEDFDAYGTLA